MFFKLTQLSFNAVLLQNKEFYHYMKSYSPVDNIRTAEYPNILVTAGLHDPRVGYWYAQG